MKILAGCDFVSEITHAGLVKKMRASSMFEGRSLRTPFEMTIENSSGTAHIMVDEWRMDINGDNTITLDFDFSRSSLYGKKAPVAFVYPLSGTIRVNVLVKLVQTAQTLRSVALDFYQCPVTLTLSPDSQQRITLAAAAMHKSPGQLTAELVDMIRTYLQGRPQAVMDGGFSVTPNANGSLEPLVFRSLRLQCFGPADRTRQGIGLFGNFFADTQNAGNPASREMSAVPPGQETLAAMSLRTFQTFQFCPSLMVSLARKLNANREPGAKPQLPQLPAGSCGGAGSIVIDGVTITSITANFGPGHIRVNVDFEKSGTCYEASGTMSTLIRLLMDGSTVKTIVEPQTPNIRTHVDDWCVFASVISLGFMGPLLVEYLKDTMTELASKVAVSSAVAMAGSPIESPSPDGVILERVAITYDELSFTGRVAVYQPPPDSPNVDLVIDSTDSVLQETRRRSWDTRVWCIDKLKRYPYEETLRSETQNLRVRTTLVALPVSLSYSVRAGHGPWQPLGNGIPGDEQGSVIVKDLECRYPTPLAAGGSIVVRDVELLYRIESGVLKLSSQNGQGNFSVTVRAEVTDANGQAPPVFDPTPIALVHYRGDVIVMGDEYIKDINECGKRAKALSDRFSESVRVPRWKQVFNPEEVRVLIDLERVGALGTDRGDDMSRHYRNAYGELIQRAAIQESAEAVTPIPSETAAASEQLEPIIRQMKFAVARLQAGR